MLGMASFSLAEMIYFKGSDDQEQNHVGDTSAVQSSVSGSGTRAAKNRKIYCPTCGKRLSHRYLKTHQENIHRKAPVVKPLANCPICGKSMLLGTIKQHMSYPHACQQHLDALSLASKAGRDNGQGRGGKYLKTAQDSERSREEELEQSRKEESRGDQWLVNIYPNNRFVFD
jgi:endogenous inhibitor of DNA gyrase (YacG/DUF329 family)